MERSEISRGWHHTSRLETGAKLAAKLTARRSRWPWVVRGRKLCLQKSQKMSWLFKGNHYNTYTFLRVFIEISMKEFVSSKLTRTMLVSAMYRELSEEQWGVCAICGNHPRWNKKLNIDHDHETGKVRWLLCSKCNMMLWRARDSVEILESAIEYLNKEPYGTDYDWVCGKGSEFFNCSMTDINKCFWKNQE